MARTLFSCTESASSWQLRREGTPRSRRFADSVEEEMSMEKHQWRVHQWRVVVEINSTGATHRMSIESETSYTAVFHAMAILSRNGFDTDGDIYSIQCYRVSVGGK